MLKSILSSPFVHFFVIGALLLAGISRLESPPEESDFIRVDRENILTFIKFRERNFNEEEIASLFDSLSEEQQEHIVQQYVQEEAMYRDAIALQLDKNDNIIRRRLIQKVEYMAQGFADAEPQLTENELSVYYEAHTEKYVEPALLTFTHVFIDQTGREAREALTLAHQQLEELNQKQVGFSYSLRYGDRFPLARNYVEKDQPIVAAHFGDEMAEELFELKPDKRLWQGPFKSPRGYHLVLLIDQQPKQQLSFAQARGRVFEDLLYQKVAAIREAAIGEMINNYKVERVNLRNPGA